MRRASLALLWALMAVGVARAELRQQGVATQEFRAPGLAARHAELAPGTRARVANVATGMEIEVTVVEGLAPGEAIGRIVDLSPAAALALGIPYGGIVRLAQVVPRRPPKPPPIAVAVALGPEGAVEPRPAPAVDSGLLAAIEGLIASAAETRDGAAKLDARLRELTVRLAPQGD